MMTCKEGSHYYVFEGGQWVCKNCNRTKNEIDDDWGKS